MANEFLNDLIKASTFLEQNLGQLQMNRTISRANEAVQQIKTAEGDEQQKRAQLQQVSQALATDLARFGAPADTIQMLAQNIAPQRFFQTPEQALINPDMASPEQKKAAQGLIEQDQAFKLKLTEGQENRVNERQNRADQRQARAQIRDAQKQFFQASKDVTKATAQARNALTLLKSGNEITPGAIGTMLARASGEVGNLTAMERSAFEGRQDLVSVAQRYLTKRTLSDLPDRDKKALQEIAQIYMKSGDDILQDYASTLTGQISSLNETGMDEDKLHKIITGGRISRKNPEAKGDIPEGFVVIRRMDKATKQTVELLQDPKTGKLYRR